MVLGQKVLRVPTIVEDVTRRVSKIISVKQSYPGIVVYIHPEGRFHVVEFTFGSCKIRESYFGVQE